MPLVVHLRGAASFTAANVATFIDKVVAQAGDLPVEIAQGGGYGGIDQPTLDALSVHGDASHAIANGAQTPHSRGLTVFAGLIWPIAVGLLLAQCSLKRTGKEAETLEAPAGSSIRDRPTIPAEEPAAIHRR